MKKILLTGFERFQGESINPSEQIVRQLSGTLKDSVEGLILPVSYERAFEFLKSHLEKQSYQVILMLGQASGRRHIGFERVAINLMDSETADEDQVLKKEQKILHDGSDAYVSELPLRQWVDVLRKENLPVEISNTAGTFVCNALYYQVLSFLSEKKSRSQALFVHVPYLPEQVEGKSVETPSLSLEIMLQTIQRLIQEMA